jgi:ABC-type polysaccharide/polyol phosphate export permease
VSLDATAQWTENRPTRGIRAGAIRELWESRELVLFLALRDFKAKYKQAVFGVGWAVIQPFAGVIVFTIVFRKLAGVPSDGIPYVVFALLGFVIWSYFAASLTAASGSLVTNAALVTKVYFPRLAAPVAGVLPGLVGLGLGLVLVLVLMAVYGIAPGPEVAALPLVLLGAVTVALGAGLLFATLNVKYRDVTNVLGLLTQLWLLASPVAYPSSLVPSSWQWVYSLNPITGVVDSARWSLLDGPAPGVDLVASVATTLALLGVGLLYFQRTEREFADVI